MGAKMLYGMRFYTDPHVRRVVISHGEEPPYVSFYTDPHVRRVMLPDKALEDLLSFYTDPHVRRVLRPTRRGRRPMVSIQTRT